MSTTSSTSTKSTSSRARNAGSASADDPSAAAPAPETAPTEAAAPAAPPALRKKELIERIVQTSGMKRRDVKPVVEATLAVVGQALASGESLNIQPLGRIVVNRRKELVNGEVLITRIRRTSPAGKAEDGADLPPATTPAPAD